jgi:hypothetical protein
MSVGPQVVANEFDSIRREPAVAKFPAAPLHRGVKQTGNRDVFANAFCHTETIGEAAIIPVSGWDVRQAICPGA